MPWAIVALACALAAVTCVFLYASQVPATASVAQGPAHHGKFTDRVPAGSIR